MMYSTPRSGALRARSKVRLVIMALLWFSTVAFAPAVLANGVLNAGGNKPILAQAGQQISSSEAAEAVQQRFGGRVLNVETSRSNGGTVYRVKILQEDGRIRTISVDAQSGRILDR